MSFAAVKSPTSIVEQVDILRSRGLRIEDEEAARVLSRVSYYRLSAYMPFFRVPGTNSFVPGASLSQLVDLYTFDKIFRSLAMSILESTEVAFRSQVSIVLSHNYGALGYKDPINFSDSDRHAKVVAQLAKEIEHSREPFVAHHMRVYGDLPVWAAMELLSYGALSQLYGAMTNEDRQDVACYYGSIPHRFVGSWLHSLSTFRNICAHYRRTYGLQLVIKPSLQRSDMVSNQQVFAILFVMGKLQKNRGEWDGFVTQLAALIEEYEGVDIGRLGFPCDWEARLRKVKL